jgi:hypothetical protein
MVSRKVAISPVHWSVCMFFGASTDQARLRASFQRVDRHAIKSEVSREPRAGDGAGVEVVALPAVLHTTRRGSR